MSKSRPETNIDPLDVIEKYGTDTLRFTLATGTALGQDQRFQMEKIDGIRNFSNKIWNAARFVLMNLEDYPEGEEENLNLSALSMADRYILSRLQWVTAEVERMLSRYDLGGVANLLYDFIWSEFCDWYIEMAKPALRLEGDARRTTQTVLVTVLRQLMVLLHPYMPFITEEIWQTLPHQGETLMLAPWPTPDQRLIDEQAEAEVGLIMNITRAIRNIRAEAGVDPGRKVEAIFLAAAPQKAILNENQLYLTTLAGLNKMEVKDNDATKPSKAMTAVVEGVEIFLPLAGMVDLELELKRLQKEQSTLEEERRRLTGKLANEQFVTKAPPAVVEKERKKLAALEIDYAKVTARLAELSQD